MACEISTAITLALTFIQSFDVYAHCIVSLFSLFLYSSRGRCYIDQMPLSRCGPSVRFEDCTSESSGDNDSDLTSIESEAETRKPPPAIELSEDRVFKLRHIFREIISDHIGPRNGASSATDENIFAGDPHPRSNNKISQKQFGTPKFVIDPSSIDPLIPERYIVCKSESGKWHMIRIIDKNKLKHLLKNNEKQKLYQTSGFVVRFSLSQAFSALQGQRRDLNKIRLQSREERQQRQLCNTSNYNDEHHNIHDPSQEFKNDDTQNEKSGEPPVTTVTKETRAKITDDEVVTTDSKLNIESPRANRKQTFITALKPNLSKRGSITSVKSRRERLLAVYHELRVMMGDAGKGI